MSNSMSYTVESRGSLNLGFCSMKAGGRWNTSDAALIKIPAVKPHIRNFLCSIS